MPKLLFCRCFSISICPNRGKKNRSISRDSFTMKPLYVSDAVFALAVTICSFDMAAGKWIVNRRGWYQWDIITQHLMTHASFPVNPSCIGRRVEARNGGLRHREIITEKQKRKCTYRWQEVKRSAREMTSRCYKRMNSSYDEEKADCVMFCEVIYLKWTSVSQFLRHTVTSRINCIKEGGKTAST